MRKSFRDLELKSREGSSSEDNKMLWWFVFALFWFFLGQRRQEVHNSGTGARDYSALFYGCSYLRADILCALLQASCK